MTKTIVYLGMLAAMAAGCGLGDPEASSPDAGFGSLSQALGDDGGAPPIQGILCQRYIDNGAMLPPYTGGKACTGINQCPSAAPYCNKPGGNFTQCPAGLCFKALNPCHMAWNAELIKTPSSANQSHGPYVCNNKKDTPVLDYLGGTPPPAGYAPGCCYTNNCAIRGCAVNLDCANEGGATGECKDGCCVEQVPDRGTCGDGQCAQGENMRNCCIDCGCPIIDEFAPASWPANLPSDKFPPRANPGFVCSGIDMQCHPTDPLQSKCSNRLWTLWASTKYGPLEDLTGGGDKGAGGPPQAECWKGAEKWHAVPTGAMDCSPRDPTSLAAWNAVRQSVLTHLRTYAGDPCHSANEVGFEADDDMLNDYCWVAPLAERQSLINGCLGHF